MNLQIVLNTQKIIIKINQPRKILAKFPTKKILLPPVTLNPDCLRWGRELFKKSLEMLRAQVLLWSLCTGLDLTTRQTTNNHRQKSWDTFAFLGCFSIHTSRTPPLTPQTMLDASIQNFFWVSILYRVGEGRTARKFRKWCPVLRGNREMTGKYAYCSTVPRTFVHEWRF